MTTIDDLLTDWEGRWLESLKHQIYALHHRRQIHDDFLQMLDAQHHPDTDVFRDAFHGMYIESQVMAIRRQADDDPRTLSLCRLMGQLFNHRREFTRSWYVARWMKGKDPNSSDERERLEGRMHLKFANEAFDRFTDRVGEERLGGRRLQEDMKDLRKMTEDVVRYVNAHVAHVEAAPEDVSVTYDSFHRAVDHLGEMLKRYYLLINQGGLVTATPTIQGDWKGPFRRPLVR